MDDHEEGFTRAEYAQQFGLHYEAARHELQRLVAAGEIIPGRAYRIDVHGYRRRVIVYRPAEARGRTKNFAGWKKGTSGVS